MEGYAEEFRVFYTRHYSAQKMFSSVTTCTSSFQIEVKQHIDQFFLFIPEVYLIAATAPGQGNPSPRLVFAFSPPSCVMPPSFSNLSLSYNFLSLIVVDFLSSLKTDSSHDQLPGLIM